ncbi:hypothetical protein H920_17610 [Fukomys damarensis]|uniref:Uncharacterized protein n=1 Tax=Fukomys damarensis TaxID=885580 RepID=A0A091CRX1_FUKDA|nr:hypothetical protein H920_17610 [Fukomys damarensis]
MLTYPTTDRAMKRRRRLCNPTNTRSGLSPPAQVPLFGTSRPVSVSTEFRSSKISGSSTMLALSTGSGEAPKSDLMKDEEFSRKLCRAFKASLGSLMVSPCHVPRWDPGWS